MPRGEYRKYFARDVNGDYAGSEAQRAWTETELDCRYAIFTPLRLRSKT